MHYVERKINVYNCITGTRSNSDSLRTLLNDPQDLRFMFFVNRNKFYVNGKQRVGLPCDASSAKACLPLDQYPHEIK